ncbi:unnamed protein product [Adineta ricciae]|uniref:Uncharacterized protein n=1 Tax=Adineta ricciae TaxID=249248 RepID=A0A814H7U6_ADIRI|nr:unnamed protein product [Adineta ricciae]
MPVLVKPSHHSRENETPMQSPLPQPSTNFRILKVIHGSRLQRFKYCPKATTSSDLSKHIREVFGIAANQTFTLVGEDNSTFVLTPVDFDTNEIFRLQIGPGNPVLSSVPTPPMHAKHSWKYYGKILLNHLSCLNSTSSKKLD